MRKRNRGQAKLLELKYKKACKKIELLEIRKLADYIEVQKLRRKLEKSFQVNVECFADHRERMFQVTIDIMEGNDPGTAYYLHREIQAHELERANERDRVIEHISKLMAHEITKAMWAERP